MASYNKIILIGNLVADPELKQTPAGVSVCSFSIAVNRRFTKQGEQQQVDFFNVTCWRERAEFVSKYFSKGRSILVSGEIHQRSWTDNTGAKRYSYDVIPDEVGFVDRKNSEGGSDYTANSSPAGNNGPSYGGGNDNSFSELTTDDELPF